MLCQAWGWRRAGPPRLHRADADPSDVADGLLRSCRRKRLAWRRPPGSELHTRAFCLRPPAEKAGRWTRFVQPPPSEARIPPDLAHAPGSGSGARSKLVGRRPDSGGLRNDLAG